MVQVSYKGRKRLVHIGKNGGKYVIVQGTKRYLRPKTKTKMAKCKKKMKGGINGNNNNNIDDVPLTRTGMHTPNNTMEIIMEDMFKEKQKNKEDLLKNLKYYLDLYLQKLRIEKKERKQIIYDKLIKSSKYKQNNELAILIIQLKYSIGTDSEGNPRTRYNKILNNQLRRFIKIKTDNEIEDKNKVLKSIRDEVIKL